MTYPVSIIDCASTGFCTLSLAAVVYDLGFGMWVCGLLGAYLAPAVSKDIDELSNTQNESGET